MYRSWRYDYVDKKINIVFISCIKLCVQYSEAVSQVII